MSNGIKKNWSNPMLVNYLFRSSITLLMSEPTTTKPKFGASPSQGTTLQARLLIVPTPPADDGIADTSGSTSKEYN